MFLTKEHDHDYNNSSLQVCGDMYVHDTSCRKSLQKFLKAMEKLLLDRSKKYKCLEESPLTDGV